MSETAEPPRAPTRRAAVLLVTLCLVATGPAVAASESGREPDAPHRWVGYAIDATGDADGGWIGGYRVGQTELYVTTPTRKPNRAGYRAPRAVDDVAGRAASVEETERAAWILSKYGGYRDATQAAAVDATVYHLLAGGKWHVGSARGARRIRQSGDPASVARFARIMLRQSRASAGAYTARLVTSGADLGGTMAVTLTVLDGHGRPASGLPVTLAMSGGSPRSAVTGDDGRAVARFVADVRGWQDVTATVRGVPDHLLHVWPPEKKGQAAAAEGGTRRTLVVSTRSPVRGPQTLGLAADPAQLVVGSEARVVASVTGDGTPRTVAAALYGPFSTSAAATCVGAPGGSVSGSVAGDGSYSLPSLTPAVGGYYAWRVAVDGTDTSISVSGCGATVKVLARPVTNVTWVPSSPSATDNVSATASVSGLPFPAQVQLRITLYQDAVCGMSSETKDLVRFGNGSVSSDFFVPSAGTYSWRAETSAGDLWVGTTSACRQMSVRP